MEVTDTMVTTVRKGILELLQLYASPEEQTAYPATAEWLCMWFDDSYHPESPVHHRAFSVGEREALTTSNAVFEQVTAQLGDLPADPKDFVDTPAWQTLMSTAQETLQKMETSQQ